MAETINRDYLLRAAALLREFAPQLRHVYDDVQLSVGDYGNSGVLEFWPALWWDDRNCFKVYIRGPRYIDIMLGDIQRELTRRAILFRRFDFLRVQRPMREAFSKWFAHNIDKKMAECLTNEA